MLVVCLFTAEILLQGQDVVMGYDQKQYRKNRVWVNDHKDVPCVDCGIRYPPYVMEFDHRPSEKKLFRISAGINRKKAVLLVEMAKCDIVCANCHRIRTHKPL